MLPRLPALADQSDDSLFDYQLRTYLHLEGGDLQRAGSHWDVEKGSFLRLGPTVELRVNFPRLVWGKDLSFTGFYSYMFVQDGPTDHESLLKLSAPLALLKDTAKNRRLSVSANYIKGGLELTKQEVDTLTLGVSILY